MWDALTERLPSAAVWINALLTAAIPAAVFGINRALHRYGDPPWKKNDSSVTKGNGRAKKE